MSNPHVLVVDDEVDIRVLIQDILTDEGYGVEVAANAEQVRKLLQSQGYTNVSELSRDSNGRWTGTATKNGERKLVAVALPNKVAAPSTTN